MNRVGRRGDLSLVERYGNDFVASQIPDIANLNRKIVARLPLDIEYLIERVGELVSPVVICKRKQLRSTRNGCRVRQSYGGGIARGRSAERRSPGIVERGAIRHRRIAGRNEALVESPNGRANLRIDEWWRLVDAEWS